MTSHRIAIAIFMWVAVGPVGQSQRCYWPQSLGYERDCEDRPWSAWSSDCDDLPCGQMGTESRYKINTECYEDCPERKETRYCYGILPVDCILGSWSEWSSCDIRGECNLEGFQNSTRRKTQMESCGGTCEGAVFEKSRPCECLNEGTPVNGTCQCEKDYDGACCEKVNYHKKFELLWVLTVVGVIIVAGICRCLTKNSVGPE